MSFAVHTFETHPDGSNTAFAFHEHIGEGQEVYFLAKFPMGTDSARVSAETLFGAVVDALKFDARGETGDRFEDALKATNRQAQKLGMLRRQRPEIVISFFDFQTLYVATSGQAQASLVRSGALSRITEEIDGSDLFNNLLSGQIAVEDVVILSNKSPIAVIPASQVGEILSRENFDDAVSALRHELTAKSPVDLLVTILGIGKKSASGAAGFLSKMVSKISTPSFETDPVPVVTEEKVTEKEEFFREEPVVLPPRREELKQEEELQEELFAEQEEMEELRAENNFEAQEYASREYTRPEPGMMAIKFAMLRKKASQLTVRQIKTGAVVVFGILILVLFIRFVTSFETQEISQMREQLSVAREALQQADTFLVQGDRASAAELLLQAQQAAQTVLNSKSKDYRSDAQFILADVQEKQLQVENAKKVQPQLLADLTTQSDTIDVAGILDLRGNVFAYDAHTIHKTVRNIVEKGVSVTEKSNIVSGAARVEQSTLLFYTDAPQIVEFYNGVITPMSTADTTWKKGIDVQSYNKYVYVLDPVENQIWKYERQRSAYTVASAYNQGADLSRAVSFAIDGAIYVLSDDGTIQKLFRGEKQDFSFREMPSTPLAGQNIKIFTTDELDYLYVLDPDNARILVFTKGDRFATYKKQVLFGVSDVRDFTVDPSGQKINIVTKNKIYEFSL
jgi:type II secretory pathway pseudopilin PulG